MTGAEHDGIRMHRTGHHTSPPFFVRPLPHVALQLDVLDKAASWLGEGAAGVEWWRAMDRGGSGMTLQAAASLRGGCRSPNQLARKACGNARLTKRNGRKRTALFGVAPTRTDRHDAGQAGQAGALRSSAASNVRRGVAVGDRVAGSARYYACKRVLSPIEQQCNNTLTHDCIFLAQRNELTLIVASTPQIQSTIFY